MPDPEGPYERAVRTILTDSDAYWWPDAHRVLAVGCPPWLVDRLATETGAEVTVRSGGNVATSVEDVVVLGCTDLDGPGAGAIVVHDLLSGWWYDVPTRCHPEVAPHRWPHLTLALHAGLNPCAAADLAAIGWH
jgi:hypothetical protein